jgi:hypothetical protein
MMGRACRTYGEDKKAYKILFGKSERKKLFESLVSDTIKVSNYPSRNAI